MEHREVGDRQLDALLERIDKLTAEVARINRRLEANEGMLRIAGELSQLNESLQTLAYAALGRRGPDVRRLDRFRAHAGRLAVGDPQGPDAARAEVPVVVAALPQVAAADRAAEGMAVLGDRHDEAAGAARLLALERVRPFVDIPAVILEAGARARRVVHLFPVALADVADVEVACLVEREPPRIAQSVARDRDPRRA